MLNCIAGILALAFGQFASAGEECGGAGEYWDPAWYELIDANGNGLYVERGQDFEAVPIGQSFYWEHRQTWFEQTIVNFSTINPRGENYELEMDWSDIHFDFVARVACVKFKAGNGDWAWAWRWQEYGGECDVAEDGNQGELTGFLSYDDLAPPV